MDQLEETKEERRKRQNREKSARYKEANRVKVREANLRWREANPEKAREASWKAKAAKYATPEGKASEQERSRKSHAAKQSMPNTRDRHRRYYNKRLADDASFKLAHYARKRIRAALKSALAGKCGKALDLLGCTPQDYKVYLEGLFQPGMSWENYGVEWHIDHLRPIASFNLADPLQQTEAFEFRNTAPAWATENLSKGSLHDGVRHRYDR